MKLLEIGQKAFVTPKEGERIQEMYRVTSNSSKEYYRIICTEGEESSFKIIQKEFVLRNDITIADWHCKITIEKFLTNDNKEDIMISIYNKSDIYGYPFLSFRQSKSKESNIIHQGMTETPEEFVELYNLFVSDLEKPIDQYSFVCYVNDTVDTIINFILLNQFFSSYIIKNIEENNIYNIQETDKEKILREYLFVSRFMDYFRYNFGIVKVMADLYGKDYLDKGDLFILEAAVQDRFIDYILVQYSHDINIDKIKDNFIFVQDKNDITFILNYHSASEIVGTVL